MNVQSLVGYGILGLLVAVAVVTFVQTWRRTRFRSLLLDDDGRFSSARLLMLMPTLALVAFIWRGVLTEGTMPELPPELFTLYLASQVPAIALRANPKPPGG